MKTKVLIDKSVVFTRTAVLQEDQLVEFYLDSNINKDIQNKVVQGQIVKSVKNLKSVFVDFGEEKNGLLPIKQIPPDCQMTEGARIPVQVIREQNGEKGHKLTAYINITGKYLVCMPFEKEIVVSRKIKDPKVREELKNIVQSLTQNKYGFIIRTNAQLATKDELEADILKMMQVVDEFMNTKDHVTKGIVLFEEMPLYLQILRDLPCTKEQVEIITNDETYRDTIEKFKGSYCLSENITVTLIDKKQDMFFIYNLEKEMSNLLKKNIWLKNGGNIVVESTEAMTVVDVNSAKAILSKNQRKSVVELNKLAIAETIKQVVLRNISGIIIIDLVDLKDKNDKETIDEFAKQTVRRFDQRTKVYSLTPLGLLQMARTKQYISVYDKIYTKCNECDYKYGEYTLEYLSFLIEQKIRFAFYHTINKEIYLKCNQNLYEYLIKNDFIGAFKKVYDIEAIATIENEYTKNKFLFSYHQH